MKYFVILILIGFTVAIPYAYADCNSNVNYDVVLEKSELVFVGTVTRNELSFGPQKVHFDIHEVIKGEISGDKYIFLNYNKVRNPDESITSSSNDVDYRIGKTYKVYAMDGKTSLCTTKLVDPPSGYEPEIWEPGPTDGFQSTKMPLHEYQEAKERESYIDALSNGSIVLSNESPKLSDEQLDDVMDKLLNSKLDRSVLPIASIAIDYEADTLVLWTPDLTIGNKVQDIIGNVSFVLLYEEAPARWFGEPGPAPEPKLETEPEIGSDNLCPPGKVFDWDICVDKCPTGQIESNGICRAFPFVEITPDVGKFSFIPIYVVIGIAIVLIISYKYWRKRK